MARSTSSRTRSTPSPRGGASGPARGRGDFLPVLTQADDPGPKRIHELASANYGERSWTLPISPRRPPDLFNTTESIPRLRRGSGRDLRPMARRSASRALEGGRLAAGIPMSLSGIGLFLMLILSIRMARRPKLPVPPRARLRLSAQRLPGDGRWQLRAAGAYPAPARPVPPARSRSRARGTTVIIRLNYPAESRGGWVTGHLRRWSAGTFLVAALSTRLGARPGRHLARDPRPF